MKVTFTKRVGRYDVYVSRDRATDLFMRSAPGYDEWLPLDVLHFAAETEYELDDAIFGHLASGGNARMFIPVDPKETVKIWRQNRIKNVKLPDALATQWHELPPGGALTLDRPRAETSKRAGRPANAAAPARRAARSSGRSSPAAGRGGRARRS